MAEQVTLASEIEFVGARIGPTVPPSAFASARERASEIRPEGERGGACWACGKA
jgi:hypothetical protein